MKKVFVLLLCALLFVATTATAAFAAGKPFAAKNGTQLMNPVEFSDGAVYCASIELSKDPEDEPDCYYFYSTAGDYSHKTVAEDWMNALLNSGYYELLVKSVGQNGTWYNFDYVGIARLPECDDIFLRADHQKTDLRVYVRSDWFSIDMNPSLGFITEPVEEDRPSPRYDDDDDYDYDYDDDDDDDRREKCSFCNGEGEVDCIHCVDGRFDCGGCYNGTYRLSDGSRRECSSCRGKGWKECSACRGKGEKDCSFCNNGWR